MKLFIRLQRRTRRINDNNTNNNDTTYGNGDRENPSNGESQSSTSSQQHQPNKDSSQATASSILTLLAIQAVDASQSIVPHNYYHILLLNGGNQWYNKSSNGTLGPCTCDIIINNTPSLHMAWKGERNQTRSRLEVCPAITTSLASSCKPIEPSLTICQRTYALLVTNEVHQNRYFTLPLHLITQSN